MGLRPKWQVMVGAFALCWLLYFTVPCIGAKDCLSHVSDLFDSESFNLMFLMILFLMVSVLAGDLADLAYRWIRKTRWFRPRLGDVLVARGFITRAELEKALDEQKLRIGDLLLQAGKISSKQQEKAVVYQKSHEEMRMGEVLIELGYVTKDDVNWALQRSNRKLGNILVERSLITDFDLRRMLGRMWYGRYRG
jgi:hypothetical protein